MTDGNTHEINVPPENVVRRSKAGFDIETLPQATGNFYNSLIDTYLLTDGNQDRRQETVDLLIEGLPSAARSLYRKGLQVLQDSLEKNHLLLEQHKGQEIPYLVSYVMKSHGKTQGEIDEFITQITPDKATFIEPAEGVAIIRISEPLFSNLKEKLKILERVTGIYFPSKTDEEPDFIVVEESSKPLAQDSNARHEFHHLIWDFLGKGKFTRKPKEESPEISKAFHHFRDELAARLVQGTPFQGERVHSFVYTDNKDILTRASNAKNFAVACMEIAKSKNIDQSIFLFSTMTSRSFDELEDNFLKLTPIDKEFSDVNMINRLLFIADFNFSRRQMALNLQRIFQEKHIDTSNEIKQMLSENL